MGDGRTVIVVDDDPWNCETIAEVLSNEGFRVRAALDGEGALAHARVAPRPCVMLLDLMMPHLSGWQVIEALRADPMTADIPVIACTAALFDPPASVTSFVRKPFDAEALLSAVEHAFAVGVTDRRRASPAPSTPSRG